MSERLLLLRNVMETVEQASELFDFSDSDDNEPLQAVISLCECALKGRKKKKTRDWMKSDRDKRYKEGSLAFLTHDNPGNSALYSEYLKIEKEEFHLLLSLVEGDIRGQQTVMRDPVSPEEKLGVTLRFLVSGGTYKEMDEESKLSTSFICRAIPKVCMALWNSLKEKYLKFPSTTKDWTNISRGFYDKWKLPNCLGVIDIKHINHTRKSSVLLLLLSDAAGNFLHVEVLDGTLTFPDALEQSELGRTMAKLCECPREKFVKNAKHLPYVFLANHRFPLQKYLLTPYPSDPQLSWQRTVYNNRLAHARQEAEEEVHNFVKFFRILSVDNQHRLENLEIFSYASVVLRNFLMNYSAGWNRPNRAPMVYQNESSLELETPEHVRDAYAEYFSGVGRRESIDFFEEVYEEV